MAQKFTFANACLHAVRTEGPGSFIWKYVACYALGAICLVAIGYMMFRPLIGLWFDAFIDFASSLSEAEREVIFWQRLTEIVWRIVAGILSMIALAVMFWAVFEAAAQRRYVREEGFSLRLGGDEFRLMLIGLIWLVFLAVAFIFSAIAIALGTASLVMILDNPAGGAIVILSAIGGVGMFWAWLAIRLAPAAAMTVRDGQLVFFGAWGATRGRFWALLGVYAVLLLVSFLTISAAVYLVGSGIAAAIEANVERFMEAEGDPLALFMAVMRFDILGSVLTGWILLVMLHGMIALVWAGPAALAAKTDPRGGGVAQAPDVFA
ncbi:hypothetical protein [Henriciella sp.]|uniref:hypothetical protein n=1 Tax=Henriciella sp. TaxID=1968823 RepID=UPI0026264848|nr:hypothetical protein [Henriciella sp.]